MDTIKQNIKKCIMAGQFFQAQTMISGISQAELESVLFQVACDEHSLCAYSFICFLLCQDETVHWHSVASTLLNIAFCHVPGGYQTSYYHTQRAAQLDPNDVDLQEALLFFNIIPEKILSDQQAKTIATHVLQKNPASRLANRVLVGSESL